MSWSRTLKVRQILRAQLEAGETISLLFSDLRGFSAFTAARGDRAAYELARRHEETLRAKIDEYGIVVKSFGDGVMAAFARPLDAIRSAVEIQEAARVRNRTASDDPIDVGIGVASGTPVMTDVDFIGHSVNLAQRLSSLAKGGQILVSERVQKEVSLPAELALLSLGARVLPGVGREVVAEVTWLKEVARISDGRDRLTLILTEGGALVVEIAKDPKRKVREAIAELRGAQRGTDGLVRAALQRTAARIAQLGLPEPLGGIETAREFPLDQVRLAHRGTEFRMRCEECEIVLGGVSKAEAARFLREAERVEGRAGKPD